MEAVGSFRFKRWTYSVRCIFIFWNSLACWKLWWGSNLNSLSGKRLKLLLFFFLNSCWTFASCSSCYRTFNRIWFWVFVSRWHLFTRADLCFRFYCSSSWDSRWCWMLCSCILMLCSHTRIKTFILRSVDIRFSKTQTLMLRSWDLIRFCFYSLFQIKG